MDIQAKINEVVEKVKSDPSLMEQFKADPVKTVEKITGVDLPDDQIKPIVDGIKAKVEGGNILGSISDALGGILGGKKE
ncbi:MAG: hypothetical protein IKP75_09975 [Oscillospiraceae bacterium]|jgi:uncharacterized protein YpuA (DUF1002 family)|nr:hypothetical protein [Oscillospiraceae bacterium]MBR4347237.1 hypothetical protein [Oscillospiraceae bacterium]